MNTPLRPSKPLWEQPICWAGMGLLLMVGGWNLSTWRPTLDSHRAEQETQVRQIRTMSEDPELNRRLDRLSPVPPFELPGRLLVFAGVATFLFAVVRMYRAPRGLPRDEMPEPDTEPSTMTGEDHPW